MKRKYAVRFHNGTVDTVFADDRHADQIAALHGWGEGGVAEVRPLPYFANIDLASNKLSVGLAYATSLN
jgi:hypothetical protein